MLSRNQLIGASSMLLAGFVALLFFVNRAESLSQIPISSQSPITGQSPITTSIPLKKKLEFGLKPRHPKEFAFIRRVVTMVEQKKLPRKLVEATFNWARKKFRRYRFPYFERALKIEAAKRGIIVK